VRTFATVATSTGAYGIAAVGASTAASPYAYRSLELTATTYDNLGTATPLTRQVNAIAVDATRSALFAATTTITSSGFTLRCTIDGLSVSGCRKVLFFDSNSQQTIFYSYGNVAAMAISADGVYIYFVTSSRYVYSCTLSTSNSVYGCRTTLPDTVGLPSVAPKAAQLDDAGNLLLLCNGELYKCPVSGTTVSVCTGTPATFTGTAFALAPTPATTLWVAESGPAFWSFEYASGALVNGLSDATPDAVIGGSTSMAASSGLLAYVKSNALTYAPYAPDAFYPSILAPDVSSVATVTLSNNINTISQIASI
jgi:hypothetical protein